MFLLDYEFEFVDYIKPLLGRNGEIEEFYPQDKYDNIKNIDLNPYGAGSFCKFSIHPKESKASGVYAFFIDDKLAYIGRCKKFEERINQGYGNISPRNCFQGGQLTNCKINKLVLNACRQGGEVKIYFYKTCDFINVEYRLIKGLKPPYNSALSPGNKIYGDFPAKQKDTGKKRRDEISKDPQTAVTTKVKKYIRDTINKARQNDKTGVTLVSGEIHRELGLTNRMPLVCRAMYSMMGERDTVIHSTPSGLSSTIEITYIL